MPAQRYVSGVGWVATGSAELGVALPTPRSLPEREDVTPASALGLAPEDERVPAGSGAQVVAWIEEPDDLAERARRGALALEAEDEKPGGNRGNVMAAARKAITAAEKPDPDPEPEDDPDDDEGDGGE